MLTPAPTRLSSEHLDLRAAIRSARLARKLDHSHRPWCRRPCQVRVLLVCDDSLHFSDGDFGLSTFVRTLLDMPLCRGQMVITLAHISRVSNTLMLPGEPRIARRIPDFKFDDPSHFSATAFDQVWLFGKSTSFPNRAANGRPSAQYPNDRLGDAEIQALTQFMDGGGGVFATGDHGTLGRPLCHRLPRVRMMRLWNDTATNNNLNEVSMTGPRRNDTNRRGDVGSQFEDQSDDIPQHIEPKMYRRRIGFFEASFPHPLLCGPMGLIDVLPDHPHEGECVVPTDVTSAASQADFPTLSGTRPLPELVAHSRVLPNTTSGTKAATTGHRFGAICAYDGHRAGIGRVVTDATWHHFVNVNLVGDEDFADETPKGDGFLHVRADGSAPGAAAFDKIRAYYRNIAIWLCRPSLLQCLNGHLLWHGLWKHQLLEAVTIDPRVELAKADPLLLHAIGKHARDVFGRLAGRCETHRLILDLLLPHLQKHWFELLDPWPLDIVRPPRPEPDPAPWFDVSPLLDIVLGGVLVALRERFPDPHTLDKDQVEQSVDQTIAAGAKLSVARAVASIGPALAATERLFAVARNKPAAKRRTR